MGIRNFEDEFVLLVGDAREWMQLSKDSRDRLRYKRKYEVGKRKYEEAADIFRIMCETTGRTLHALENLDEELERQASKIPTFFSVYRKEILPSLEIFAGWDRLCNEYDRAQMEVRLARYVSGICGRVGGYTTEEMDDLLGFIKSDHENKCLKALLNFESNLSKSWEERTERINLK